MYISSWQAYTKSVTEILIDGIESGLISTDDIVWQGPSGDFVIGDEAYDEEYADYTDTGTVEEWVGESE